MYNYMSHYENHVNVTREKLLDVILLDVKINYRRGKKAFLRGIRVV